MITYALNDEQNGIELTFDEKPSEEVREQLKSRKFRWSHRGFWYAKQTPDRIDFAKELAVEQVEKIEIEYPEIDIDDLDSYTIPQHLQDREHDANWIFRKEKRDHSGEIKSYFESFHSRVLELLEMTESEGIAYNLKRSYQSFKKKYYGNYVARLQHKANNPSWAVTGRGGLNMSRYQKGLDRFDKLMGDSISIAKDFEDLLGRTESKIYRDITKKKDTAIKKKLENTNTELEFKTVTKEFEFIGYKEKKRVHVYEDYWIAKTWGCFRIFKGEREIHSMKSKDKLTDAKKYVAMVVQHGA